MSVRLYVKRKSSSFPRLALHLELQIQVKEGLCLKFWYGMVIEAWILNEIEAWKCPEACPRGVETIFRVPVHRNEPNSLKKTICKADLRGLIPGGRARVERLGTFLDALRSSGAALCVVSLARQDMCVPYTLIWHNVLIQGL
jgi:hypothetical protein